MDGRLARNLLGNQPVQGEFACTLGNDRPLRYLKSSEREFSFPDASCEHGKRVEVGEAAGTARLRPTEYISPVGSQVAIPNHDRRKATAGRLTKNGPSTLYTIARRTAERYGRRASGFFQAAGMPGLGSEYLFP